MKNFYLASVITAAALHFATAPLQAATLQVTFEDPRSISYGPNNNPFYLASPILTLRFANTIDYSTLSNPTAGPFFYLADLVSVEWARIENLAFIEQNPRFSNPPLTQTLFDSLTYLFTDSQGALGLFAPVSGNFLRGSIFFAQSSTTTFTDGPMVRLARRFDTEIRPTGNWDNDEFNDAATWGLQRTSVVWNPSATSFAAVTPAPNVPPVPLPAGFPLLLAGLGALFVMARRTKAVA